MGATYSTVFPTLPSERLIAWTSAWTTAGWPSPAITRLAPLWAVRSDTSAANQAAGTSSTVSIRPPATFDAQLAASERAKPSILSARNGKR